MIEKKQIHKFAVKWCEKFRNPEVHYLELIEHRMADECEKLEFEMDSGNAFYAKYGDAVHNYEELRSVIEEITDISLLGSAVFSRWRYFNHWAYSGAEILEPQNRLWFILALEKMAMLTM